MHVLFRHFIPGFHEHLPDHRDHHAPVEGVLPVTTTLDVFLQRDDDPPTIHATDRVPDGLGGGTWDLAILDQAGQLKLVRQLQPPRPWESRSIRPDRRTGRDPASAHTRM